MIRDEVARGRLVITANEVHLAGNLEPIGIGIATRTKINANIGKSAVSSDAQCEVAKVIAAVKYGADTVMDLSTGEDIDHTRTRVIEAATVPIGTVPMYQAAEEVEDIVDMTADRFLEIVQQQARQGVDYMTIHCALLREHLPLTDGRITGIVSRGGSLTAKWMVAHGKENPFYERFDDLCDIMRQYDVTWSLGDALRPGCLADASDQAQFAELKVMGELTQRAWDRGCQVMCEGPGHIPLDQIEMNVQKQMEYCHQAPFYVLGPIVTDIAPGYDHITSAIGATMAAWYGAAMLCYVTPKEHLGLPNLNDVRDGVIAYKIAAHAADIARGRPGARDRDDAISRARFKFDWEEQFRLALDPEKARSMREETIVESPDATTDYCSMCGPKFCSMRTTEQVRRMQQEGE